MVMDNNVHSIQLRSVKYSKKCDTDKLEKSLQKNNHIVTSNPVFGKLRERGILNC